MIKYLKHIKGTILEGLFISLILFASVSIFDKELSEKCERFSQTCSINKIPDNKTDAVLTDAFLYDAGFNLYCNDIVDHQIKSTKKHILLNTNIKIITAYKFSCKTYLNLRPIIYLGLKIHMSSYHPYKEPPQYLKF